MYFVVVKPVPGQNKEKDSRYNCLNMILKKKMSRFENRLKTLGNIISNFGNDHKNFEEDKSREDFDKLLQLRGIRKNDYCWLWKNIYIKNIILYFLYNY